MIKFFRQIRQSLIMKNQTEKYFKYAIGEIILVVIGILIALQVNNWNERRVTKIELDKILVDIKYDLEDDLKKVEESTLSSYKFNENLRQLQLKGNTMSADTLLKRISAAHRVLAFKPKIFGYSKLTQHTQTDILPKKLTKTLSSYYNIFTSVGNNTSYENLSIYSLNKLRDYLIDYGFPITRPTTETPKNIEILEEIITDRKFQGILRNVEYNRVIQIMGLKEAQLEIKNSINAIETYLKTND
ncbi:DUF6090 family protein [Winogradskyella sp. A3E31]|uniref:DUF6090 family protein n=1 Tax=Winogradskyella sp. A3E31 TaxID=3349637 RepID=UPI00398A6115